MMKSDKRRPCLMVTPKEKLKNDLLLSDGILFV